MDAPAASLGHSPGFSSFQLKLMADSKLLMVCMPQLACDSIPAKPGQWAVALGACNNFDIVLQVPNHCFRCPSVLPADRS